MGLGAVGTGVDRHIHEYVFCKVVTMANVGCGLGGLRLLDAATCITEIGRQEKKRSRVLEL